MGLLDLGKFVRGRSLKDIRSLTGDRIEVKGRRVVDVGCGYGNALKQALCEGAVSCVGFESDKGLVERLNHVGFFDKLLGKKNVGCEFRFLPAGSHIPLADSSADVVICSFVLPYVANKLGMFREIMRVLAPGGRAYVVNRMPFSHTSLSHLWTDSFLLVDSRYGDRFERIKRSVESGRLTNGEWQQEDDPDVREFGRLLDTEATGSWKEDKFEVRGMPVRVVGFHSVFAGIVQKCSKVHLEEHSGRKSLDGVVFAKDSSFSGEDAKRLAELFGRAERCWSLNMSLKEQNPSVPIPQVLTLLDSKIFSG